MSSDFDWSELAFSSKKIVNDLEAVFVAAPREISQARFKQLVKAYLPRRNIILGLAKETFVEGFEDQPHFRTTQQNNVQKTIDLVNQSANPHKIYTLRYFQRELRYLLEKLKFKEILLVNGSWKYAFHTLPAYYTLAKNRMSYTMISPFANETEARQYEETVAKEFKLAFPMPKKGSILSEKELLQVAQMAAKYSFDYNNQTGVVLAEKLPSKTKNYRYITQACNRVVPFQTYALLHGASREQHYAPPHDLNHYDTVHAEVELLIQAQHSNVELKGATVFINVLPCPPCARMLSETSIDELVYIEDHSSGYAVKMLEMAGKKVRRVVNT